MLHSEAEVVYERIKPFVDTLWYDGDGEEWSITCILWKLRFKFTSSRDIHDFIKLIVTVAESVAHLERICEEAEME
jgi:hypothetical protein